MICPNPKCGRIVSPFDEKCPHCGATLEANPVKDYEKKAGQIIKEAESNAEDIKEQIRSGFREQDRFVGMRRGGFREAKEPSGQKLNETYTRMPDDSAADQKSSEDIVMEAVNIVKIRNRIIYQQQSHLENMKSYVFTSRHVLANKDWKKRAEKTHFVFDWDDEKVNAKARAFKEELIEEIGGAWHYEIVVQGGYVNFAYAVASASKSAEGLYDKNLLKEVIGIYKKNEGRFSIYNLIDIMPRNEKLDAVGDEAAKVIFECIAHELGHVCYGHVHSPDYNFCTNGENIGQEYDADSFAYATIDTSASKEELWLGLIRFMIVRAVQESFEKRGEATTHPFDVDRLKTAISRFPDLAKKYRINEAWAEDIVTRIHIWLS